MIKHLQVTEQKSKAQDNVGKLKHLLSLCHIGTENQTKQIGLAIENIENRRRKNRDLIRDREYCREDLTNTTSILKSLK